MRHVTLNNWHLECAECGTVRNEPFCPVCIVPTLGDDSYTARFDGVDGAATLDALEAGRVDRAHFKDGDTRDLVDLIGGVR